MFFGNDYFRDISRLRKKINYMRSKMNGFQGKMESQMNFLTLREIEQGMETI